MVNISGPLLDSHSFRQTQTAISVFWFIKDGITLPNITPVFGWPWAVPFEFPIYQVLVYSFYTVLGLNNLDLSGRIISYIFYVLSYIPLFYVLRNLKLKERDILIIFLIVMTMPVYLFWSRTFMIESTALFLCLCFVASFFSYIKRPEILNYRLIYVFVFALLACLVKITSLIVSVLFVVYYILLFSNIRQVISRKNIAFFTVTLASIFISLVWVSYADDYKLLNPISSYLVSDNLMRWNFGAFERRFDLDEYTRIFSIIKFTAGYAVYAVILLPILLKLKGSYLKISVVCMLTYISAFLLFFNLYYVHDYYWYANSVFLAISLGFILLSLLEKVNIKWKYDVLIILISVIGYFSYQDSYFKHHTRNHENSAQLTVANYIKKNTLENDYVYIHGMDWSPVIPYYAERKAIMIPNWESFDIDNPEFKNILRKEPDLNLGALVICGKDTKFIQGRLDYFNFQPEAVLKFGNCSVIV